MPYKDRETQLAYNRAWIKKHPSTAANTPLCEDVITVLKLSEQPLSRASILAAIGYRTTPGSLTVALNRMKRAGRIRKLGGFRYATWEIDRG